MSDNPFYRLAPFIQAYIYRHNWTELRDVQLEACRVLFDTDSHLILAAGTASGKTEAAFLPILTQLSENPAASVGVLYIGPTKALINDQFARLKELLVEAHMPVWAWHGDVSAGQKRRLLQRPQGVLQITPESIESLLINHRADIARLFGDLRYVVIDEIHVFMNAERGLQVLCQLARIEGIIDQQPRRVGLSATLADYAAAEQWLQADTKRGIITATSQQKNRVRLALEHFTIGNEDSDEGALAAESYEQYIFDTVHAKQKALIFANNRSSVEKTIASLRTTARRQQLPDVYHVHHGSISAPLREAAEAAMQNEHQQAITAATVTLELGIDIGQLERVLQLEAPFSVSSFLQRLGRSGRRGAPSEMWFVCTEDAPSGKETFPEQIPWNLLQAIAIVQLYLEERWIEPIQTVRFPFSLLYHQTMSTLASLGELEPRALARHVLTLPPFRHISPEEYRVLLRHLVETDHLERIDGGGLIIGLAGERIARNYRFYAVFQDVEEYVVRGPEGEIGRINTVPPVGERLALAGRTWEIVEVDSRQRIVWAHLIQGRADGSWSGSSGKIHTRIVQRIRQVLLEEQAYPYLQPNALQRLRDARQLAARHNLGAVQIIPLGGASYCVFPWLGSAAFSALLAATMVDKPSNLSVDRTDLPYYFVLKGADDPAAIRTYLRNLAKYSQREIDIPDEQVSDLHKFDEYLPRALVKKAFIHDHLGFDELSTLLSI